MWRIIILVIICIKVENSGRSVGEVAVGGSTHFLFVYGRFRLKVSKLRIQNKSEVGRTLKARELAVGNMI